MVKFVNVGDYCPNEACPDYGKLQSEQAKKTIKKNGKTKAGKQRYKCNTCGSTFTETKGTIFYRRRTEADKIIETLALIGQGCKISSIAEAKGHKEDTILNWLRAAAEHAEAIDEVLMADYQVTRGQLDAMWTYVRNKGKKKLPGNG